jgi:hypothetical protein
MYFRPFSSGAGLPTLRVLPGDFGFETKSPGSGFAKKISGFFGARILRRIPRYYFLIKIIIIKNKFIIKETFDIDTFDTFELCIFHILYSLFYLRIIKTIHQASFYLRLRLAIKKLMIRNTS